MPLEQLIVGKECEQIDEGRLSVDVIAVHGIDEDPKSAWTDEATGILWLSDLLPRDLPTARVLTFGYNARANCFYGEHSADRIQQQAHTLVAELYADRKFEGRTRSPIIFICHGLGGILVKKALAYSSTRIAKDVQHLYSIYISTYAVLFFGTPHHGTDIKSWQVRSTRNPFSSKNKLNHQSAILSAVQKDCETLQAINDQFDSVMRNFRLFFFWEGLPTAFEDHERYVVEESSAAPVVDNTERAGIYADHAHMTCFTSTKASGYRIVVEALKRFAGASLPSVAYRWQRAEKSLAENLYDQAYELLGAHCDDVASRESIERPSDSRKQSETSRNKFFQLPQAVSSIYTGRHATALMIQEAFWSTANDDTCVEQKRFVIYGIGGSGKTQFCSKFAQDNRQRFWGVFWIDATSEKTAKTSFANIGKLGGMEATQSAGMHWLSTLEESWLLIINNADDPSLDIGSMFPPGERGYVLLTTRNPHFRTQATVGSQQFQGLVEDEAMQLFLRAADSPRPWDNSTEKMGRKIASALGYLALALIHAGALIVQKMCSMQQYLSFYQDYRKSISGRRISLASGSEDHSIVYAQWEQSIDAMEQRQTEACQDAIDILSIVGFYHFESIGVDIFQRALANQLSIATEGQHSSLKDKIVSTLASRLRPPPTLPNFLRSSTKQAGAWRIRRALHELSSWSLIDFSTQDDKFSLHPVAHTWVRDRLKRTEQKLWGQIAVNVIAESILLPPKDRGKSHEDFRRDLLIHMDFALKACPFHIPDVSASFTPLRLPITLSLYSGWVLEFREQVMSAAKCGYVYLERGRFEDSVGLWESVKDALIATRGHKDMKTQKAMLALANNYWGLGQLVQAIDLQKKVLESQKETLGIHNAETLSTMNQLGSSYWLNGQYGQALELQQSTVKLMKQSLEESDDAILSAMDNLGLTLGSWRQYEQSKAIHEQVLDVRWKTLGADDLATLTTMNNVAMALKDLGDFWKAKALMEIVVRGRKHQLGREHPWTLWAICNLAKVKTELGMLKEAENDLVEGIAAGKRSLGDDHLGVLMGIGELARIYARQGRWDEAIPMAEDMIERLKKSRGLGHPDTLYGMSTLALAYKMQGRLEDAISICESAERSSTERLPSNHPLVESIVEQLRALRKQLEESEHASQSQGQSLGRSTSQGETQQPGETGCTKEMTLKKRSTL